MEYRIERDTMGEMRVPADALYGAQTQRAVENFPISRLRFPRIRDGMLAIRPADSRVVRRVLPAGPAVSDLFPSRRRPRARIGRRIREATRK